MRSNTEKSILSPGARHDLEVDVDPASEALIRSTLHDLANAFAGLRGILELSDPEQPLGARNRARMDAVLTESLAVLARSRHLAMGTLPDGPLEAGEAWRLDLKEELHPMEVLFRTRISLAYEGDPAFDRWGGELLRGYTAALTRQVVPYAHDGTLGILFAADAREWRIRWSPAAAVPESLRPELDARPRDISARWALRVGGSLGACLSLDAGSLLARIPRF